MKRKFIKFLSFSLVGLMFLGTLNPIHATVEEKQTIDTNNNAQTEVIYNQESTFSVILPKLIDLGTDKTTDYTVTVTGDISSDETIFVVPDDSFYMKDKNTSNPKDDVEAVVTQNKTEWKFNELETIGNGNVIAEDLSAGTWEGKFYFNIKLANCDISVTAKDEEGNNLNASATYITGEEKDNLLNSLEQSGLVDSKEDVDAIINVESDDFDGLAETTFDVSDIAKPGDKVTILHFDETKGEWEYIGTEIVDENGLIKGDFTSYSPVIFVKVDKENNSYEHVHNYIEISNTSNCTTDGIKTLQCACGEECTETVVAPGHNYIDNVCDNCGATKLVTSVPSKGTVLTINNKKYTVLSSSITDGVATIDIMYHQVVGESKWYDSTKDATWGGLLTSGTALSIKNNLLSLGADSVSNAYVPSLAQLEKITQAQRNAVGSSHYWTSTSYSSGFAHTCQNGNIGKAVGQGKSISMDVIAAYTVTISSANSNFGVK